MIYSESGRWGDRRGITLVPPLENNTAVMESEGGGGVAPPAAHCVHRLERVQLKQRRGSHWIVAVVDGVTGTAQRGRWWEFCVLVLGATERVSSQEGRNGLALT